MEKGFLSPKGKGKGNGVNKNQSTLSEDPAKDMNHFFGLYRTVNALDVCLYPPIPTSKSLDGNIGKQTNERADLAKILSIDSSSSVDASAERIIPVAEGSSETTTEGIDNDIYSIVDACPNVMEMWKAIKILKQVLTSITTRMAKEPDMVAEDDALSKEKEIDKLLALIYLSFKKIYKPTNNNLRTSSNTIRANQDNTLRMNKGIGHVAKECQKPNWAKDSAYHKEKMLLYRELETHYLYMAHIQEVTLDAADNSGPIFDTKPLQKVQSNNDEYNVFANERQHPEQLESVNDTYLNEQGDTNITIDLVDMSTNGEEADQDDDDFPRERDLLL
ncbi:hypothetical protein Tco_1354868 [Tanacetum coccineum]